MDSPIYPPVEISFANDPVAVSVSHRSCATCECTDMF
jgi:hypothetical protein